MDKLADISAFEKVQNQAVFNWMRYAHTSTDGSEAMLDGYSPVDSGNEVNWKTDKAADMDIKDMFDTIMSFAKASGANSIPPGVPVGALITPKYKKILSEMYGIAPNDIDYLVTLYKYGPSVANRIR